MAQFGISVGVELPQSLFGIYNIEFFIGMTIAFWFRDHTVVTPRLVLATGVALFIVAALAEDTGLIDGYADGARLVYGPAAALVVLGAAETGRQNTITVPVALQTLGSASYSIYLFQFVFIGLVWKLWLALGLDARMPHAASFLLRRSRAVAPAVAAT
jgi:peptidoglycan/LPS O-acetylase OafA/YrhL